MLSVLPRRGRVAEGMSDAEIGERPHIGVTTVKTHVTVLMAKTGAPNRVRLALVAKTYEAHG